MKDEKNLDSDQFKKLSSDVKDKLFKYHDKINQLVDNHGRSQCNTGNGHTLNLRLKQQNFSEKQEQIFSTDTSPLIQKNEKYEQKIISENIKFLQFAGYLLDLIF